MASEIREEHLELQDMRGLLYSMVAAFTKAIDERTPYNASHTMQVAGYVRGMVRFLNRRYEKTGQEPHFSSAQEEQIVMAAYLHDVGKLVIPLEVMNKANRLGQGGRERIHERYLLLKAYLDIDRLEGRLPAQECFRQQAELEELEERIGKADGQSAVPQQEILYFTEMGKRKYTGKDGAVIPWLTRTELQNLQIAKGTLNEEERRIMEYHAVATEKILQEIRFGRQYESVVEIVGAHHEFLDGSGYPKGLQEREIPPGARILTIADIYDSLVATDRPYKRPMSMQTAKRILGEMAQKGKLDRELTALFCTYLDERRVE